MKRSFISGRTTGRARRSSPPAWVERLEGRQLMSGGTPAVPTHPIPVDPTGFISGTVYNDANANGRRDPGEGGLAGRTVYIDANNDRILEPDERRTVTAADGSYAFVGLPAGHYMIRQVPAVGWRRTDPAGGNGREVWLSPGEAIYRKNFGQTPAPAPWRDYGGNAQHTGISSVGSQSLDGIKWQTPVDLQPQLSGNDILIHYGEPLFTADNVMILPVKTGATDGFELQGRRGSDGKLLWTVTTDYILPPHGWTPSFSPALTRDNRVYFAGAGGTVYYVDHVNQPGPKTVHQLAFYGLAQSQAHKSELNATVFIDTPITVDSGGNAFFGVQVTGDNPLHLSGGIARISSTGVGTFVTASGAAGDASIDKVAQNCAPALSRDGKVLYLAVDRTPRIGTGAGILAPDYLLALDSTTLATVGKVALIDPLTHGFSVISDSGTASPTVGPDGDVYYGVLDNGNVNHDRGWLLHFNSVLTQTKTPGAFGWDDTASVVPASMVPSYHGTSKYLLMTKYNDYAGNGGTGVNKIAILDPNAEQMDGVSGACVMKEVETIAGVTPDKSFPNLPHAVREWCINTAVVDVNTDSILTNSEDGKLYRWNLATNSFTQVVKLTDGIGEAYTPTLIGPDGTVYAINNATLFAVGAKG